MQLLLFLKYMAYHTTDIVKVKGLVFDHKNMEDEKLKVSGRKPLAIINV